jgi:Fur family transcriptional regulator, stress-responsive regulator
MKLSFANLLKERSLSLTPVRLAVLESLVQHPHSDAVKIYEIVRAKISTTSKQAIYNNLNTLVEEGLVREIKPKGQSSLFETRTGDNHHHIMCKSCNMIMDTDCHSHAPCLEPKKDHGFVIEEAEIIFWGTCPSCHKKNKKIRGEHRGKS